MFHTPGNVTESPAQDKSEKAVDRPAGCCADAGNEGGKGGGGDGTRWISPIGRFLDERPLVVPESQPNRHIRNA